MFSDEKQVGLENLQKNNKSNRNGLFKVIRI